MHSYILPFTFQLQIPAVLGLASMALHCYMKFIEGTLYENQGICKSQHKSTNGLNYAVTKSLTCLHVKK